MVAFEQQIPVRLQFRAMSAPMTISVPGHVLHYLDTYAERGVTADGQAIYHQPDEAAPRLDWKDPARIAASRVM